MINATETHAAHQQSAARTCPNWCISHETLDAGTPDECVVHQASRRYVEGVTIALRQTEFADGEFERPFLYVDDQEMSIDAAIRLATGLLVTIADATR